MVRTRNNRETLLPEKTERCTVLKPQRCLRTECLVSAFAIGLLAMFVTWGSSAIVKAGYDLVQARACLTKMEKQNEVLRLEMAQLKAPQRIQNIAVRQLGMIKPQAVYVAAKESSKKTLAKTNAPETVTAQRSILFGNAKAEAHNSR
jgi:cell division protein FtsB